jgi:hypothetical protein
MKKSLVALAAMALVSFGAMAQSAPVIVAPSNSWVGENNGRISIQSSTYATVNGNGTSFSAAGASADAYSTGSVGFTSPIVGNIVTQGITMSGSVGGTTNAYGYNVSTGPGATGSAVAGGWSDASFNANANHTVGDNFVSGQLNIDGGMQNNVLNGTDAHVVAGKSQDGFVNTTYAGTGWLVGNMGQNYSNDNQVGNVTGEGNGSQTAQGSVQVGGITFTDGTPTGQNAAQRYGNSGVQVNVIGSFDDPVTGK